MKEPVISVVMPVYNGEKHLAEAIDSILNQTYTEFEFIILNDGSTDKTEEIILSYTDSRIVYTKNETNFGIVKTLNKGIGLAKGKYIARMDADDISLSKRFEIQVKFMEKNPNVFLVGTWYKIFFDELTNKFIFSKPFAEYNHIKAGMIFNCQLGHPTVMFRNDQTENIKYNLEYENAEDFYLWSTLINSHKIMNIPTFLLNYRISNNSISSARKPEQIEMRNKIILENLKSLLSILPSGKELELHVEIVDNNINPNNLKEYEGWLLKLKMSNNLLNNIDKSSLEEVILNYWFNICANLNNNLLSKLFIFCSNKISKNTYLILKTITRNVLSFIQTKTNGFFHA